MDLLQAAPFQNMYPRPFVKGQLSFLSSVHGRTTLHREGRQYEIHTVHVYIYIHSWVKNDM